MEQAIAEGLITSIIRQLTQTLRLVWCRIWRLRIAWRELNLGAHDANVSNTHGRSGWSSTFFDEERIR